MSPCKKAQGSEGPLKACGYISSFLFGLPTSSALVVGTAILDYEDEAAPREGSAVPRKPIYGCISRVLLSTFHAGQC